MVHLVMAVVMTTAAVCGEAECENPATLFKLTNSSSEVARMYTGAEGQQAQVGTSNCMDTSLFLIEPGATREVVQRETVCGGDQPVRNVSVAAGRRDSPCTSELRSFGESTYEFTANLVVRADWNGTTLTMTVDDE